MKNNPTQPRKPFESFLAAVPASHISKTNQGQLEARKEAMWVWGRSLKMIKLFTESLPGLTKTLNPRADLSREPFSSYQLSFTKNFTRSQRAEHALGTAGSTGGSPTARCSDISGAGSALGCRGIQSLPSTRASRCAARSMTPVLGLRLAAGLSAHCHPSGFGCKLGTATARCQRPLLHQGVLL